jgi:hypothetical protein
VQARELWPRVAIQQRHGYQQPTAVRTNVAVDLDQIADRKSGVALTFA